MRIRGIKRLKRNIALFVVNKMFPSPKAFNLKNKMLNFGGFNIGKGTKVVGPFVCTADITIGENCWIGKNFLGNGNGKIVIGDNCDIAPEVIFQTGGHKIGDSTRRAGEGESYFQKIGNGTWIGGRSTIVGNVEIGNSCVIAACACVTKNFEANQLIGGVPAKVIRELSDNE